MVKDVTSCITYCLLVPGCDSFNYDPRALLCQLNNATARQYPLDMRRTSNPFEYYESVPVISVVANGS